MQFRTGRLSESSRSSSRRRSPRPRTFFPDQGKRAASFVFDMQDPSEIPGLVEPLFKELEAEVQLTPVMNLEDLQKGLSVFGR